MILECTPRAYVVVAIGRIVVVVAVACWIVTAIVIVIATSIDPVVGIVGLSVYPQNYKHLLLNIPVRKKYLYEITQLS